MATRKKPEEGLYSQDGELLEPPETGLVLDADASRESDEQALLNVLEQLGGEADGSKVMVYRITDDKRKPDAFLRRFSPAEFAFDGLETLLRLYGGGLYKISVYGSNGRLIKNPTISIEAPAGYKPEGEKPEEKPQSDIASQVTQSIVSALSPVLQQIGQAISQPKENRSDFLSEMIQMKTLFDTPQRPADPGMGMLQMFELFKTGIEFGKEAVGAKGESNENDVLMGLLEKFGGPIAEAVLKGNQGLQQNQGGIQHPENYAPVVPKPEVPVIPQVSNTPVHAVDNMSEQEKMIFGAKQAIGFLCSQAERNADVETYAFLVSDQLDDQTLSSIIDDPAWFENLKKINQKVSEHQPWFSALRDRVKEILTDDTDSADNQGNSPDTSTGSAT